MIVRDISSARSGCVSATVAWENCTHASREIYFETDAALEADLAPNPNAFLLAAYVPALCFGEERVQIDGAICPMLRSGLEIVAKQLAKWYSLENPPPVIEPRDGFVPGIPADGARAALCMSGGVDSLASMRRNRLDYPIDHPRSFRDLLFIHGFDVGGNESWQDNTDGYSRARALLEPFASAEHARILPIRTNIRFLEEDSPGSYYTQLFVLQSFAACLAACAHAFAPRVSILGIPSSHDVADLEPLGSHPLLDPNYSSSELAVIHDGLGSSRMDKVRLIAEWDAGLAVLRVCADPSRPAEQINCGRCEKCLRTMVSLLILGKLDRCPNFGAADVDPEWIARLWWRTPGEDASPFGYMSYGAHHFWEQIREPLAGIGRPDLVAAIDEKLAERHEVEPAPGFGKRIVHGVGRRLGRLVRIT